MLVDGFYHADPHPGNLRWWNDKIYFLDLGMVGEVEPNVRELMLLLILAFAQKDARFLSEVVLLLGAGEGASEMQDLEAFRNDLTSLVEKHGALSLKDIQLGPLIQEISEVAVRHDVRIPAELALAIKAMSQMQLAAGGARSHAEPIRSGALVRRPQRASATSRVHRSPADLLHPAEGQGPPRSNPGIGRVARTRDARRPAAGAIPGAGSFEQTVRTTGRRLGLGLASGAAIVATAVVAASPNGTTLVTTAMGLLALLFGAALVVDIVRSER